MVKRTLAVWGLGLILVYFLYTNIKMGYYNVWYSWDIKHLAKQTREEIKLNAMLKSKLKAAKEEPYIESQARTILGLVKKGEIAYQINAE